MLIWKRKETIHGTQEQSNATSILGNEKTLSLDTMPQIHSDRVIIPNHIRVPDAERVAIRFGSFDINFMQKLCLKLQADIDNGSDVAASKTQQEMNSDVGNVILLSQPSLTLDNDKGSSAFKCAEELIENTPSPHIAYEIEEVVSSNHLESLEQRGRPSLIRRGSNFYIPTTPGRIISGPQAFLDPHGIPRLMSFIASSNDGVQVFMLRTILCEVGSLPCSFIHCSIASVCTRPLPSVTINVLDDGASEIDRDDFDVSFNIISRKVDFSATEIILEQDTPYYSSSHNLETRSHDISSFPSIEGEETNIVCVPAPVGNNVLGLQAFHDDDPPDCNISAPEAFTSSNEAFTSSNEAIRRHSLFRTIRRRVGSLVRPFICCLCI